MVLLRSLPIVCYFPLRNPGRARDMKSEHIDNRKLYEVVNERAILDEKEVEHLSTCDECLEMVRILIRQQLSNTSPS
jgi:hypothetical protein